MTNNNDPYRKQPMPSWWLLIALCAGFMVAVVIGLLLE